MEDLTVTILEEIRAELQRVAAGVDATNERLDATNERLDATNERLENVVSVMTETHVRIATELVALASSVDDVRTILVQDRKLRDHVEDHERRLQALERKAG